MTGPLTMTQEDGVELRERIGRAIDELSKCGLHSEKIDLILAALSVSGSEWRTDTLPFEERPIYQFVLVEGWQEHSGQTWHRRWAGSASIHRTGRFGYRAEDIDRIQRDGDMAVVSRVVGWMPATYPRWDFDALAAPTPPVQS